METVKRLATTVSTSSTNQENKPAWVRKGSLTVEISAEVKSNRPTAEMLPNSKVLFQFLGIFIVVSRPSPLSDREFEFEFLTWHEQVMKGRAVSGWLGVKQCLTGLKINQSGGWSQ